MASSDPLLFNYPVHNTGGHYDPTTGIYTTPIDGTYEFILRIRAYEENIASAWLMVDGVEASKSWYVLDGYVKKSRFLIKNSYKLKSSTIIIITVSYKGLLKLFKHYDGTGNLDIWKKRRSSIWRYQHDHSAGTTFRTASLGATL